MLTGCVISQSSAEVSGRLPPVQESDLAPERRTNTDPETIGWIIIKTRREGIKKKKQLMIMKSETLYIPTIYKLFKYFKY